MVTMNRNYKTALSLEDFGDKAEFKAYVSSVNDLAEAMLKWAQADRNNTTDQKIIDNVFEATRKALVFFSDTDFKVKADNNSVHALRDTAIKMHIVYTDEYREATKKRSSFDKSIKIHLKNLNVVIPMYDNIHDLDAFINTLEKSEKVDMLKKAINSYDAVCSKIAELEKGEYCWYEPTLDNKFRNHFEDFVSDRINDKLMHEVENIEAKKQARAEKQRAKRKENKKTSK